MKDGVTDCFFSIGDLDIFSVGLLDAALNVIQDVLRLLKTRIIEGDDREISQSSGDLRHLETASFGAVSTAAKGGRPVCPVHTLSRW